jgi:phospholipid/cholesterol/gamma-HCH transport system substrate-binding protein
MHLSRHIKIQLIVFTVVAVIAGTMMVFGYIRVPAMLGIGRYTVTVQLPWTGGLYERANVTYRGTEVGRVTAVRLTDSGVDVDLSLRDDVRIPADVTAEVHSVSAIGEQYVALVPRSGEGRSLRDGDVITRDNTVVPPEIGGLLDATNRGLQAIPREDLKTVIDESYTAVGGLGPDISRIVNGSTRLALDAHRELDSILTLIDRSGPVLDSQADTADSIREWAAHLADITRQVRDEDAALGALIEQAPQAADEARQLMDRFRPTVPVLMANLAGIGELALTYQPGLEQLLVLIPMGVQVMAAGTVANRGTKNPGLILSFNLNLNLPPPCTTGYLPAQQQRTPSMVDTPDRPEHDLYCRIPQDSWIAVRGARNLPCMTRPGKRAPTAKMCKSDEEYVPLNDGFNWKGDPNATLSGQDIPQKPPEVNRTTGIQPETASGSDPAAAPATDAIQPPIATAYYDPATGSYLGPDGRVHKRSDLAAAHQAKTWQSMLTPP